VGQFKIRLCHSNHFMVTMIDSMLKYQEKAITPLGG